MDGLGFFLRALMCAGMSSLGSVPIGLLGDMSDVLMGTSISVAAGMMTGCSIVLAIESMLASSCLALAFGMVCGALLIYSIEWIFAGREDLTFGDLKGSNAAGALVIFLSMLLHSLGEGLSIGVSATDFDAGSENNSLNSVVLVALGIHNIPEGMAICISYRSKGMSMKRAALYAFLSNLPQPLTALVSFGFMQHMTSIALAVPIGLGMASGAMCCVVLRELLPEALERVSRKQCVPVMVVAGLVVIMLDACSHFGPQLQMAIVSSMNSTHVLGLANNVGHEL